MKSTKASLFLPLGLLFAGALAVGVFVVPLPMLDPSSGDTVIPEPPGVTSPGTETQPEIPVITQADWSVLADALNTLRAPLPDKPNPLASNEPPEDEPDDEPAGPGPFLNALQWEYMAHVVNPVEGGGQQVIAWLSTERGQRAVAEGQRLVAEISGRTQEVVIKSVSEDAVVIETKNESRTLKRIPNETASTTPRAPGARAFTPQN